MIFPVLKPGLKHPTIIREESGRMAVKFKKIQRNVLTTAHLSQVLPLDGLRPSLKIDSLPLLFAGSSSEGLGHLRTP